MVYNAGIKNSATKSEAKRAIVTVIARWANNAPPNPLMRSNGKNITTLVNVDATSDGAIARMAFGINDACLVAAMDSMTTMPQSTSMPTHIVNPPNDIMLMLIEKRFMKKKVMIIDTGIAMVIINAS